jgi:outer membrane protein assembly factor BamE (lipoprotein component of BamABCDE complex)
MSKAMKRKRLLLILGCLAAGLLAVFWTLPLKTFRNDKITLGSREKIRVGMTEREVETILGGPAGVYAPVRNTGEYCVSGFTPSSVAMVSGKNLIQRQGGKEWVGETTAFLVQFDQNGKVSTFMAGLAIPNESFLDKLRRWLGL